MSRERFSDVFGARRSINGIASSVFEGGVDVLEGPKKEAVQAATEMTLRVHDIIKSEGVFGLYHRVRPALQQRLRGIEGYAADVMQVSKWPISVGDHLITVRDLFAARGDEITARALGSYCYVHAIRGEHARGSYADAPHPEHEDFIVGLTPSREPMGMLPLNPTRLEYLVVSNGGRESSIGAVALVHDLIQADSAISG